MRTNVAAVVEVEYDFFSLNAIIATNATIMCNFDKTTPGQFFDLLGQRMPETISENGFRTGVMAWIVPVITVPAIYNSVNRAAINAGAHVANFERIQRHFYTLGMFMSLLLGGEEGRSIARSLLVAFTRRISTIMQRAVDLDAKPHSMDDLEKHIFKICQQTERLMSYWTKCVDAAQSKKRKLTDTL